MVKENKKSVDSSFFREVKVSPLVGLHSKYQHKMVNLEMNWFLSQVLAKQAVLYVANIDKTPNYEGKSKISHK